MKTNYSTQDKDKTTAKSVLKYAATLATAAYMTGCASLNYDVKPVMTARTTESGQLETMAGAGLVITSKAKSVKGTSEDPTYHGGFWNETGQTLAGPFHIYRFSDKKFFPEFREHPYRTTAMTLLYVGAAAAAGSGGGGSGGSKPAATQPSQPSGSGHSDPAPSTPSTPSTPVTPPSDGGQGDGGGF